VKAETLEKDGNFKTALLDALLEVLVETGSLRALYETHTRKLVSSLHSTQRAVLCKLCAALAVQIDSLA
jgi:hypothetical protein